jgi:uncharacterized protein (DUF1330 family)
MARDPEAIEALVRRYERGTVNPLEPSADQLRALLQLEAGGPLQFLNCLAYHDVARYPADHALAASGTSGAEAYALYGAVAARHVTARGGRFVVLNQVVMQLIGPATTWHQIVLVEYPTVEAFLDMVGDPDYRAALVHRDAGLARTELFVTRALLPAAPSGAGMAPGPAKR